MIIEKMESHCEDKTEYFNYTNLDAMDYWTRPRPCEILPWLSTSLEILRI